MVSLLHILERVGREGRGGGPVNQIVIALGAIGRSGASGGLVQSVELRMIERTSGWNSCFCRRLLCPL